jgi:Putative beta-barrel porin-2, OmpL-like. bbp2
MKKILLAVSVTAVLAAPGTVLAQARTVAAPAVPTLDKVLEASGINVNGYMDVAYTHADRNIETGFSDRVFDSQNNSFGLHQFGLTVAKQPKEGFGGLVNLTVGSDAQVIHSFPEVTGTNTSMFDVTQAYMQYATGPLTVIAGKFTTLHGTEVIASTGNTNFSRSILFGAVPFTHTGVRATWTLSDKVTLIGGINNGWDQVSDANRGKTLELGVTLNPLKPLNIAVSGYTGEEPSGGGAQGRRTSLDAVASYIITDPLSVSVEVLTVSQDNANGATAKYSGGAVYVTYMFMPKLRGVLRLESFNDKNGFRFAQTIPGTFANSETKYRETTATVSYLMSDSFEGRAELRGDRATNSVFTDSDGSTSKQLMTFAVQALYKF